jgi:UDP-N-acetylmuramate dehydrogenase
MKNVISDITLALLQIVDKANLKTNEPMTLHTTFKVGGPADYFATPPTTDAFIRLILFCAESNLPYFILGKGSNLIVSDKGIRGLVISTIKLTRVVYRENQVTASCGFELIKLSRNTARRGLSGLEFACGIPGSVGGAVYMNAGAYEGEISQVLVSSQVLVLTKKDNGSITADIITLTNKEHDFSYRYSIIQNKGYIHLSSTFNLLPFNRSFIQAKIRKLTKSREEKQPLELPSAGSVFRRPQGYFTGKLIEDCGLKGFRIGDAAVSVKHCGFIVNLGNATAKDILSLIEHVQATIHKRFGVTLQTEVKFAGEK